jgi:rubrerythrin
MQLTSFGSILSFAEDMEIKDQAFYSGVFDNQENAELKFLVETFIKECKKNIVNIQRTRRENVTEMILEPINDFESTSFEISEKDGSTMKSEQIIETIKILEQRSLDYYTAASVKIKSLPEVANALRLLGKKHKIRLRKIDDI